MTSSIYHIVQNDKGDIITSYTGPNVLQMDETPRNESELLAHEKALVFCYQYTGAQHVSTDFRGAVQDVYCEAHNKPSDIELTKVKLTSPDNECITIKHHDGVFIIEDAFPVRAFESLEPISERDGYIVDGKLQSEIQAALVFGHKDNCQRYREKLGVV